MTFSDQNKAFELLREKFDRHEKILIQAYKSLKQKEQELIKLNHELQDSKEELQATIEELNVTNMELSTANEEIKVHNDNLDDLVKQRSKKIEEQLNIFQEYAYLNAHEVRAPLARILGLLDLLEYDIEKKETSTIPNRLKDSAKELDSIVKSMNRLLEKGTLLKPGEQAD